MTFARRISTFYDVRFKISYTSIIKMVAIRFAILISIPIPVPHWYDVGTGWFGALTLYTHLALSIGLVPIWYGIPSIGWYMANIGNYSALLSFEYQSKRSTSRRLIMQCTSLHYLQLLWQLPQLVKFELENNHLIESHKW